METTLSQLKKGQKAIIKGYGSQDPQFLRKMWALEIEVNEKVEVIQHWPGFILQCTSIEVVLDKDSAQHIIVQVI